jgi:hypothetical protein
MASSIVSIIILTELEELGERDWLSKLHCLTTTRIRAQAGPGIAVATEVKG